MLTNTTAEAPEGKWEMRERLQQGRFLEVCCWYSLARQDILLHRTRKLSLDCHIAENESLNMSRYLKKCAKRVLYFALV
jgi:hypothetical protein